ncbi:Pentatricopeptide repeat-containing protein [Apostasia shenzhenica]|uniref:Pentatricopeptide repeat-containing protein n=1 Tax=Apostasia shenzhenica TaxID=1088818 RepID=A0A2I0B346_9ASPA|nr:Pentatricopeptide repeat-containing protein [Apostasia shenzhenica]
MNLVGRRSIASCTNLAHEAESKILTLCNSGGVREALDALRSHPTALPSSTYSAFLQFCIDSNSKEEGKLLYHHLLAKEYTSDLHLNTKFIIFFSKLGDVGSARKMFDKMPERSVVSWTALISGYAQHGFSEEALSTFSLMHLGGNKANQFTYGCVLGACTSIGCIRSGRQIQGCIEKSRFVEDLHLLSSLVDMHLKCGNVEDACSLFWSIGDRDVVLWNSMIGGHAVRGLPSDAFRLFTLMRREGKLPDHCSFSSVLRACGALKDVMNAHKTHSLIIKSGFASHYAVSGSLINAYVKCRSIHCARLLYDSLPKHDLISCTTVITGYSTEGGYSMEALKLFLEINQTGKKIDNVILCSMLNVSATEASLDMGRQIHAHAVKVPSNHDVALSNALVDMYTKSGVLEDAYLAFEEIPHKNVISWTSLITCYGKHGQGEYAVKLFEKMEDSGVKPNDVTFLSLISACSHSGLTGRGMEIFDLMVNKYDIQPRSEHYCCVVDLLGRGGFLPEAYEFVKVMNIKPNLAVWGAMLGACRIHDNKPLGESAAGNLLSLNPVISVNYVVLANIYATAGLWDNACKTRRLMEQNSTQKDAGVAIFY